MDYNSGSNWGSEITSMIIPELDNTKLYYQLILSIITNYEKLFNSTGKTGPSKSKENISE